MPANRDDRGESEVREPVRGADAPASAAACPADRAGGEHGPAHSTAEHAEPARTDEAPAARDQARRPSGRSESGRPVARDPVRRPTGRSEPGRPSKRPRKGRPAPLALAATVTTTWAALMSFIPTLIIVGFAYAIDSTGEPVARVFRLGLAGWLLSHGVPLRLDHGTIGLVPLAVSVFVAWRVGRAGVHTARAIGARRSRSVWPTVAAGVAVGVVYSLIGALAAAGARLPGMTVSIPRAALTLAGYGLLAGLVGAATESRLLTRAVGRLPTLVVDAVRAGSVAALLILGAGAAIAGMAVALAGGEASQAISAYETGVIGQAGLTLLCLLYGPNVAVWAASYLVGPGFVFGAGSSFSVADVTPVSVPALPVLAGLPSHTAPGWATVLLGLPLAAGMTAGWLLARRTRPESVTPDRRDWRPWATLAGTGGLAGVVAGALLGLVSIASSGSLGSEGMATIGPRVVPVALVAAGVVAAGVIVAAVANRLLIRAPRGEPERRRPRRRRR